MGCGWVGFWCGKLWGGCEMGSRRRGVVIWVKVLWKGWGNNCYLGIGEKFVGNWLGL